MTTLTLTYNEFINFKVLIKKFESFIKHGEIHVTCDSCKLKEFGYI